MENFNLAVLPIPDMVLHPNTMAPIYVIEPSYIEMIKNCIEKKIAIGVVIANPTTEHTVCTLAAPTILEEKDNGEISVLLHGIGRARLQKLVQHLPWPVFEAKTYDDRPEAMIYDTSHVERLSSILNSWLYCQIDEVDERERFLSTIKTTDHIIDYICMLILKDIEIREVVLASDSLSERISMLNLLLKDDNPYEEDHVILKILKSYDHLENTPDILH
ncbi:MAG: LON peptidase substrate-binding domain-containing protein [Bacteriovoracaceae bacterium]|nr:LON peptidase substrate-binding domain-containing protein [Bacteriovoracaceae bacterium]